MRDPKEIADGIERRFPDAADALRVLADENERLREALRDAEALLSLVRYRAKIKWAFPDASPTDREIDLTITTARAAYTRPKDQARRADLA